MKRCLILLWCMACVVVGLADAPPQPTPSDPPVSASILVHDGHSAATVQTRRWFKSFRVPAPPGYIDFQIGNLCDSKAESGCMEWKPDHAWVALVPNLGGVRLKVFAHEMGHVFDMYVMSQTGGREKFAQIVGSPWRTPNSEERFADAYMLCVLNRHIHATMYVGYGYKDTPEMHEQICALIRSSYGTWLAQTEPHLYGQAPIAAAPAP